MNVIQERLAALRSKMQEHGINYYVVPTADFHQSEYVGEHFKASLVLQALQQQGQTELGYGLMEDISFRLASSFRVQLLSS